MNKTWVTLFAAGAALAQTPASASAFEVAVIKSFVVSRSSMPTAGFSMDKARVRFAGFPLQVVIRKAYNIKAYQLSSPAWIALGADLFDVEAKLPDGATEDQVPLMLQALLAERFKMTGHQENREQPIYAVVVDRGAAASSAPGRGDSDRNAGWSDDREQGRSDPYGRRWRLEERHMTDKGLHFEASKVASRAEFLSPGAGRPVLDKTNLKGTYQIESDISHNEMDNPAAVAAFSPRGAGGAGRLD
jgi:uncharacterized protein (TIGR03435 family)